MTPLLELRDVSKVYTSGSLGRREVTVALDRLSLSIEEGRAPIMAVAGESGSGKTTLASLMLGFARPTTGAVLYRGRDLTAMSAAERLQFRREVQPIFQDPFAAFNPFYRVDHVLTTPIKRYKLARDAREIPRLIDEALEMVGLRPADTLGRFPHQISGGQRQRLMVARALLCRPRVILADEPVSMVDASLRATILASLQRLNRELGITIVYITHDLTTAYQIGDDIVILYRGRVAEAGAVDRVIRAPQHPYTQLLIGSIPLPDRRKKWGGGVETRTPVAGETITADACHFAARCPQVMDICRQAAPPLYLTDRDRTAACYLYREAPELGSNDVTPVLGGAGARSAAV